MSDVRLTATNPVDSTVVPVACNERGELLTVPPVIEEIDNDVTINGNLYADSATFNGLTTHIDGVLVTGGALTAQVGQFGLNAVDNNAVLVAGHSLERNNAFSANGKTRGSGLSVGYISYLSPAPGVQADQIAGFLCNTRTFEGTANISKGFAVENAIAQGTLANYGFFSNIEDKANTFNFYANGNARNFFQGDTFIGGSPTRNTVDLDKSTLTEEKAVGDNAKIKLLSDGSAEFIGDVIVGSRNSQWLLVEQGGLCHMVQQVQSTDLVTRQTAESEYPKLRDVFNELDLIEKALSDVMEKLRLNPPAGWEVWDGSDEIA